MAKPSVYQLGAAPEILLAFTDTDDEPFFPTYVRLSIEQPDGEIFTVSGIDMTIVASGVLSYVFHPEMVGWYTYKGWGEDNADREIAKESGFEVVAQIL